MNEKIMGNKRKRWENEGEEKGNEEGKIEWEKLREEAASMAAAILGARRAKKRYIGVRQRPSGRWVAEIKDTIQNIRLWLGTYDTPEDAARAYDEAARLLRGSNTRTNFFLSDSSSPSVPALPPKIAKLLFLRLKARNIDMTSSCMVTTTPFPCNNHYEQEIKPQPEPESHFYHQIEEPHYGNFLDLVGTGVVEESASYSSSAMTTCDYSCGTREENSNQEGCGEDFGFGYHCVDNVCDEHNKIVSGKGEFEDCDIGSTDFKFLDTVGSLSNYFSPFEVAEEMVGPIEEEKCDFDDSPLLRETFRMKYERQISACLYTLIGVSECLKLQVGPENGKELENF